MIFLKRLIMKENKLTEIENLIKLNKIDQAEFELSKLGQEFLKNAEYLFLRSKIYYINKLYYVAIDFLLITLEFEKSEKIYNLLGEIYKFLDNEELSKKILDTKSRKQAIESIKDSLTGTYRKN